MKLLCEWFAGERPQFNLSIASAEGKVPFLTVKGCWIVQGRDGAFVSWPATKNAKTNKYWQHVWASEPFAAAVLAEAQASMPKTDTRTHGERKAGKPVDDDPIPF
jgi:hypothetical protein